MNDNSRNGLLACVARLADGPWRLIRLRGDGPIQEMIDRDDIDLLGSRESVISLLDAAASWVHEGLCHLRVKSTTKDKVGLYLLSRDGRHRLSLDLWISLWQINQRQQCLRYEHLAPQVELSAGSLQRLPIHLEASIFIHHLLSKKKNCSDPKQLARLLHYAHCTIAEHTSLSQQLTESHRTQAISTALEQHTLALIQPLLTTSPSALLHRLANAWQRFWFSRSRGLSLLTIMGCDGSGKTTLAKEIAKSDPQVEGVYTGKHLYRKWFTYKLLVIFLRPMLFQQREKFDDTIAPLTYLMASVRLWFMARKKRTRTRIIDRSLIDFLMLTRKTDAPHFSSCFWLTNLLGVRVPHIHIVVPFARLQERKLEMTETGHAVYDRLMFEHFSRRSPSDYVLFDNRASLEESHAALQRIVDWLRESC